MPRKTGRTHARYRTRSVFFHRIPCTKRAVHTYPTLAGGRNWPKAKWPFLSEIGGQADVAPKKTRTCRVGRALASHLVGGVLVGHQGALHPTACCRGVETSAEPGLLWIRPRLSVGILFIVLVNSICWPPWENACRSPLTY